MSKTTPVRWWRDDATRYHSRRTYVAPPVEPGPRWEFELLSKPVNPELLRILARMRDLTDGAAMPIEFVDDRWGSRAILEGRSEVDPIADVASALRADERGVR